MRRLRRTFLEGHAEFVVIGGELKLRVSGWTTNGALHEVLVDYSEHGDLPIALLIRSARAAIRRCRQIEDDVRQRADQIAQENVNLRELP